MDAVRGLKHLAGAKVQSLAAQRRHKKSTLQRDRSLGNLTILWLYFREPAAHSLYTPFRFHPNLAVHFQASCRLADCCGAPFSLPSNSFGPAARDHHRTQLSLVFQCDGKREVSCTARTALMRHQIDIGCYEVKHALYFGRDASMAVFYRFVRLSLVYKIDHQQTSRPSNMARNPCRHDGAHAQ